MKTKSNALRRAFCCLWIAWIGACQTLPQERERGWTFIPSPSGMGSLAHSHCGLINGKLLAFGGIDDTKGTPLNNQLLLFDPRTHQWQLIPGDQGPSLRNFAAFSIFDNAALVIGGETAQENASADAFVYHADGRWEALPPIESLVPRNKATLSRVGSELVLFGGQGPARVTNWARYSVKNKVWHVGESPSTMEARVSHIALGVSESSLMVWGGFSGQERRGDGFIFDIYSHELTPIPPNPVLGARANARALRIGDEVIIWGGASSDGNSNSGAAFHIKTKQWRSLPPIPDPRFHELKGAEIEPWQNRGFLLFGGRFGSEGFNDQLWLYNDERQEWSIIRTDEKPQARMAHCFVQLEPKKYAVFGGIGYDARTNHLKQFDGVWILDL
jgi:N-acetylneuraminic acid mutarotase